MGINIGGFITRLVGFVIDTVKLIKGKPKFSDVLVELMAVLPARIMDAIAAGKLTTVEQLEEALQALDDYTGSEATAIDILRDLPADKEENLFDALKTLVEILGKNRLKVEGYYIEEAQPA